MKNKLWLGVGLIVLLAAASLAYYWTVLRPEQVAETPNSNPATSDSAPAVEPTTENEALTSKTERGYITSVSSEKITIDYIDTLTGSEAVLKYKEDGNKCDLGPTDERCFAGAPIYDRNINPNLRTFSLAANVLITSHADGQLSTERLKSYVADKEPSGYYGIPFDFTFNKQGEVSTITEVFRP